MRLHSDRGGEFFSDLLAEFCRDEGIHQSFMLPASPQQNGIAEQRIGLIMETSPTLCWTGQAGDAPVFRVWGALSLVRDTIASKLSPRTLRCIFLGFPTDAPPWQFYHQSSCRGPAPSSVSQVDPPPLVEPLEISYDSSGPAEGGDLVADDTAATRRSPRLETPPGFPPRLSSLPPQPAAVDSGSETVCAEPGGAEAEGEGSRGAATRAVSAAGARGAGGGGAARAGGAAGAGGAGGTAGGAGAAAGVGGTRAASTGGAVGAGSASGVGGAGAASAAGARGAGGARAGGAAGAGGVGGAAGAGGAGAVTTGGAGAGSAGGAAGAGGAGLAVAGTTPPLLFPQLLPHSPLPAPAPSTAMTESLIERREPETRASTPERRETETRAFVPARLRCVRPPRALAVPDTHDMTLHPSSVPQRVVLPSPPASSLPDVADPPSDLARASSPTVTCFFATVVADPTFSSPAVSALVAELVEFAASHRLDYLASLASDPEPACPPSVRGEFALGCDVLKDRQEKLECLAAAAPFLATMLLAPKGDPDALDIPNPRSYKEAISGEYSSQWQTAMDAEMASWNSTGTYVNEVPPPRAKIFSGIYRPAPPSRPAATTAAARATAAAAGGAAGSTGGAAGAGEARGGQQRSLPLPDDPTPQQLREWVTQRGSPGGGGFGFMWPHRPRDCASQRCVPGRVEPAALGSSESAVALGAGESAAALGAREFADALGASASTATDPASTEALHTFALDSGASRCFFPSTVLPYPAVPSGSLSCLHLPAFSTNLLSNAVLQDEWVHTFIPGGQRVAICKCSRTSRHLATFTRQPGSGLYTLTTAFARVAESSQVAASSQVFAFGRLAASCSCWVISHQTLLWHHRLGHPSLPRLRSMHSRLLVSGLPRSLPSLPCSPALPCLPCVEGRQRAAPHSSEFPPTTTPLQTLHMDV
ncbi:unnamed protein product [Closterium sp. NIES-54]